jgi:hypothetical protein
MAASGAAREKRRGWLHHERERKEHEADGRRPRWVARLHLAEDVHGRHERAVGDVPGHRAREIPLRELERAAREPLAYSDLLARILREAYQHQRQRSLEDWVRQARLPKVWSLDTSPFDRQPGVQAATIRQLAGLDFASAAQNLVFIGPTGVGKTGLASALLHQALVKGHRCRFVRAQDLFDEMYASLADRSTRHMLNQLRVYDVLLIDEMGHLNLRPEQSHILRTTPASADGRAKRPHVHRPHHQPRRR